MLIREMVIEDYEAVMALWRSSDGIGLSDADSHEGIAAYLDRNPGLSLVAESEGEVAAAVLCGHDGRRGYIHHLAVRKDQRRKGLGRRLTEMCLENLERLGIQKCHLFVLAANQNALSFWPKIGWSARGHLVVMSKDI
jgi:N-acetylglutamate synthase